MTTHEDKPEFSRMFDIRQADGQTVAIEADAGERSALAQRFDLVRVNRLLASASLERHGTTIHAKGAIEAEFIQACAVSAEDLDVRVAEPFDLRFVQNERTYKPDEEIELEADDLDEIPYEGTRFDLGEAVAQSLALAIDPFLTGPQADAARREAGIGRPEDNGPFAALAKLKDSGQ